MCHWLFLIYILRVTLLLHRYNFLSTMQFCWLTVFLISLLFPTLKCYDKLENRNVHVQTRILLNDPNLLNSRMEAMERELQTLKTKLHAQESETQDLKHQLESRTSELLEMKTSGKIMYYFQIYLKKWSFCWLFIRIAYGIRK